MTTITVKSEFIEKIASLGRDRVESAKKLFGVIIEYALKIEEGANHYIYTTYSLLTHPDGPQLKYGQVTADGKNVIQRIAEQDGTSTPEPLILIAALKMPFTDWQVRAHIKSLGFKTRPDKEREWVRNITPEEMLEIVLEFRNLTYDNVYYARPHSAWVNAQIMDKYNAASTSVIIAADLAPRFGKTLTALDLFRQFIGDTSSGTMIVSAHWLSSHNSFEKLIQKKYDIAEDIEYISVKSGCLAEAVDRYKVARTAGKKVLLALSLHVDSENLENYDALIQEINEPSFIFQDEADFGAHTERSRAVLKPFVNNGYKNLMVLGTGSNIGRACLGSNEYNAQFHGPIVVDYVDLLNAKHGQGHLFDPAFIGSGPYERSVLAEIRSNKEVYVNRLKDVTELHYAHLQLSKDVINTLSVANPEVVPTMSKLFENRNIAQGKSFLKCVFGDECAGEINFENMNAQIRGGWQTDFPTIGLFIGGNEQITPIENVVKYAQAINPDWKFVALHGKITSNEDAEDYINEQVAIAKRQGQYEGLVFVSAGVGSRSFSISNVEMVIRMIDGGSNATAIQQGLRCATPHLHKSDALIVDLCIERSKLSAFTGMVISHAVRESKRTAQSLNQIYQRLVNGTISFWNQKSGAFVKQSTEQFIEEIRAAFEDPDVLIARINWDEVFNSELKDIILKLNPCGEIDNDIKSLLQNTGKTLVSQQINRTKQEKSEEELQRIKLVKSLTTLVRSVGNLYTLAPEARSFTSALEIVASNKDKCSDYEYDTGISATEAIKLANADFFVEGDLDMILISMQQSKKVSKKCYVFDKVPHKDVAYWDLFKKYISLTGKDICLLVDTIEDTNYIESINPLFADNNNVTLICIRGNGRGYVDTFNHDKYTVFHLQQFLEEKITMKFDVTLGNPPFQDGSNTDKASRLWTRFWVKCLKLTKDDGIVSLITPVTWCSPSADLKSKSEGYEGVVRLWDIFDRFTSVADIDNVKQYFPGVGSTFGRVTVYKSGNEGLSFTNGYSTHLGFLPQSGDVDEIFSMIDTEENLKKYFKMDQEHRYGLKVGIPTTRGFIGKPDMIQILRDDEIGTSGSVDPRNYYYIYVDSDEQAQMIKDMIMNAAEMLCTHCRWAGYLNLKMVEYLKYTPAGDGKEQAQ